MAEIEFEIRRVHHPDFYRHLPVGSRGFPVLLFERREWKAPTDAQVRDYQAREKQVIKLGGQMKL